MTEIFSAQSILDAAKSAKKNLASAEQLAAARETLEWLKGTKALLERTMKEGGDLHEVTNLGEKDEEFKKFLFDTLNAGEIRIVIDGGRIRMEETSVPTVWRVLAGQQDFLVTAYVPDIVLEACRKNGTAEIVEPEEKPEGLFASPAIFSELRAALGNLDFGHFDPEEVPVAVELSRQPLSPADKTYIDKVLGEGPLEVQMLGFARSTIRQTSVKGLWRSKILSKAGKVLLDEVVAAPIPPEVPSTEDELPEAVKKLSDLIEWVELDLSRGAIA